MNKVKAREKRITLGRNGGGYDLEFGGE